MIGAYGGRTFAKAPATNKNLDRVCVRQMKGGVNIDQYVQEK